MIIEYWRRITFNFSSDKGSTSGVFDVKVDSTGTPVTEKGSCFLKNVSGDDVTNCSFDISALSFSTDNGAGQCNNFVTCLENITYSEGTPNPGTWSYVNANVEGFVITSEAHEGGSIFPSGEIGVNAGEDQAFTITPSTGFDINDVLVDSTSVGTVSTYTFSKVQADHTISASFNPVQVTKTYRVITFSFTGKGTYEGVFQIAVDSNGIPDVEDFESISGDSVVNVSYFNDILFINGSGEGHSGEFSNFSTAVPNQTYTETGFQGTWSYTLGSTITTYTIVPSAGANGSISPSNPVIINEGSSQSFTITPASGYQVASVLVDGIEAKQDLVNNVYTFTNVSAVHTIAASFEELKNYVIEIEMDLTGEDFKVEFQKLIEGITASGALNIVSNTSDITAGTGTITITETDTFPDDVFKSQTNITSVVLPDCFTEIEDAAFAGCSNMVSITLPDTMQVIGADAFSECTSLTSLELPASVTEVGEGFLDACESLEEVICLAPVPPTTGSAISTLTLPKLCVPSNSINLYLGSPVWSSAFNVISPIKPSPVHGFGFNLTKMVDLDYKDERRDTMVKYILG